MVIHLIFFRIVYTQPSEEELWIEGRIVGGKSTYQTVGQ